MFLACSHLISSVFIGAVSIAVSTTAVTPLLINIRHHAFKIYLKEVIQNRSSVNSIQYLLPISESEMLVLANTPHALRILRPPFILSRTFLNRLDHLYTAPSFSRQHFFVMIMSLSRLLLLRLCEGSSRYSTMDRYCGCV